MAFLQVFNSPQIKAVFRDKEFVNILSEAEKAVWLAFKSVCSRFLGNKKPENYEDLVWWMLSCSRLEYVIKTTFSGLTSGLFSSNLGAIGDEHV